MKKSYLYFIVPLVCTAIFAVFYVRYSSGYEERQALIEKKQKEDRDAKLREEAEARDKAVKDAIRETERRKKAKEEKDARDAKERDMREQMVQERNKAKEDARKYAEQVTRLKKDVAENKDEIAKIEQDKKDQLQEQAFLRDYVKQSEANAQALSNVLEKIDAADKARAEAARAAKKSS